MPLNDDPEALSDEEYWADLPTDQVMEGPTPDDYELDD